jgi:serine/threonine protein kinase
MLKKGFTDKELRAAFEEARTAAQIPAHDNVVGFYGVVTDPFMLVMEFCAAGSLNRFLRKRGSELSVDQRLGVITDVARGMAHLAAHNIVHRDLAARNVLLTDDLMPRIADFGMSRIVGNSDHHSKTTIGPARWYAIECIKKSRFSEKSE